MANTYVKIGTTVTVGSGGAANIEFASIPSTFTDLCILTSLRSAFASGPRQEAYIVINSSTSSTYQVLRLRGVDAAGALSSTSGANVAPSSTSPLGTPAATATANTFSNDSIYFPNYAGSTAKSFGTESVQENNSGTAWQVLMTAGLTTATTAISNIKIYSASGDFVQYSTASLYGIKNS